MDASPMPFDHIAGQEAGSGGSAGDSWGSADLVVPGTPDTASPFDTIRQRRADGTEYWSGRDLMPLLGYESWQKFESAIRRATTAAQSTDLDTSRHFSGAAKVIKSGRWGSQTVSDIHLSRHACYLVAMNGDPRKPQIAAAQTYFAVRTRQAETAATAPAWVQAKAQALATDPSAALDMAQMLLEAARDLARRNEALAAKNRQLQDEHVVLAPKAAAYDAWFDTNDTCTVRDAARLLHAEFGLREHEIRALLRGWRWVERPSPAATAYAVSCNYMVNQPYLTEFGPRPSSGRLTAKGFRRLEAKLRARHTPDLYEPQAEDSDR